MAERWPGGGRLVAGRWPRGGREVAERWPGGGRVTMGMQPAHCQRKFKPKRKKQKNKKQSPF